MKFVHFNPATQQYDLSVLVVASVEALPALPTMPYLVLTDAGAATPLQYPCEVLATWDRFTFFKFRFSITLGPAQRYVQYQVIRLEVSLSLHLYSF